MNCRTQCLYDGCSESIEFFTNHNKFHSICSTHAGKDDTLKKCRHCSNEVKILHKFLNHLVISNEARMELFTTKCQFQNCEYKVSICRCKQHRFCRHHQYFQNRITCSNCICNLCYKKETFIYDYSFNVCYSSGNCIDPHCSEEGCQSVGYFNKLFDDFSWCDKHLYCNQHFNYTSYCRCKYTKIKSEIDHEFKEENNQKINKQFKDLQDEQNKDPYIPKNGTNSDLNQAWNSASNAPENKKIADLSHNSNYSAPDAPEEKKIADLYDISNYSAANAPEYEKNTIYNSDSFIQRSNVTNFHKQIDDGTVKQETDYTYNNGQKIYNPGNSIEKESLESTNAEFQNQSIYKDVNHPGKSINYSTGINNTGTESYSQNTNGYVDPFNKSAFHQTEINSLNTEGQLHAKSTTNTENHSQNIEIDMYESSTSNPQNTEKKSDIKSPIHSNAIPQYEDLMKMEYPNYQQEPILTCKACNEIIKEYLKINEEIYCYNCYYAPYIIQSRSCLNCSTEHKVLLLQCLHHICIECYKLGYCPICNYENFCTSCRSTNQNELLLLCEHKKCSNCIYSLSCHECKNLGCSICSNYNNLQLISCIHPRCTNCYNQECHKCKNLKCHECESSSIYQACKNSSHSFCKSHSKLRCSICLGCSSSCDSQSSCLHKCCKCCIQSCSKCNNSFYQSPYKAVFPCNHYFCKDCGQDEYCVICIPKCIKCDFILNDENNNKICEKHPNCKICFEYFCYSCNTGFYCKNCKVTKFGTENFSCIHGYCNNCLKTGICKDCICQNCKTYDFLSIREKCRNSKCSRCKNYGHVCSICNP